MVSGRWTARFPLGPFKKIRYNICMGLNRFPYRDFTGGVNLLDGPFALDRNEAQSALNCSLTERGTLFRRQGITRWPSDPLDTALAGRADNLFPWYPHDPSKKPKLLASVDGDIYMVSYEGNPGAVIVNGTAGTIWCFASMTDSSGDPHIYAMNGVDTPQKIDFDGNTTNWTNAPNGKVCVVWRNRMLVTGVASYPQRLCWSDIGNPELPASSYGIASATGNWIDIKSTDDDEDPLMELKIMADNLLVFKKASVWSVYDDVDFNNIRLGSPGIVDRFMAAELGGEVYYVSSDGIYTVGPNRVPRLVSRLLNPLFHGDNEVSHDYLYKARLISTRDRRILVAIPIRASTNNLLLEGIPDMRHERSDGHKEIPWMLHSISLTAMSVFRPFSQYMVIGGSNDTLHTVFDGDTDNGVNIDCHWIGQWHGVQTEEPVERIRRINVEFTGDMYVDLYQDLNTGSYVYTQRIFTPTDPDPLWSGGTWDGGPWNPRNATILGRVRPEKRGRYHAVRFRNYEGSDMKIYTAEIVYRGGKEHTK